MSRMRDQDVQNREELKLVLPVIEPLEAGYTYTRIPSLSLSNISKVVVFIRGKIIPELCIGTEFGNSREIPFSQDADYTQGY